MPALRRQRLADLCEFKACLLQASQVPVVRPHLQKKKKKGMKLGYHLNKQILVKANMPLGVVPKLHG